MIKKFMMHTFPEIIDILFIIVVVLIVIAALSTAASSASAIIGILLFFGIILVGGCIAIVTFGYIYIMLDIRDNINKIANDIDSTNDKTTT